MSIRPLNEPKKVTLDFAFDVSDEYIEQIIDESGLRPSRRWSITFDLADVPAPARSRLRKAHALFMAVDPYPIVSAPTEDPEEFLAAIEPWMKQASVEHEEALERKKEEAIANTQFRLEMKEWVHVHGSRHLRAAVDRGYKANATYAMERSASEMPGFWVDTAGDAKWGERSDPSEEALALEGGIQDRMTEQEVHLETKIVWLREAPRALDRELEARDEEFEFQEAIVVSGYLGRYVLVLPIDEELRRPREDA